MQLRRVWLESLAVVLDSCGSQPGQAVGFDGLLPAEKLINRQCVALTGFLKAEQPPPDSRNDLSLAPYHPSAGVGGWKIRHGQRAAIWPNDVFDTWSMKLVHLFYAHTTRLTHSIQNNPLSLKKD